jgi:hypothetical protein
LGLAFEEGVPVHGLVFRGGEYSELLGFNPVIESAEVLSEPSSSPSEPAYHQRTWWPVLPVRASPLQAGAGGGGLLVGTVVDARLTGRLAQYRGSADNGVLRLFTSLTYEVFYSQSADWDPPVIQSVTSTLTTTGVEVSAALAPAGDDVHQVLATYTAGDGSWRSHPLTWNAASGRWLGQLPRTTGAFLVQAVDGAGNVAVDTNEGRYYTIGRSYLPLVMTTR